MQSRIRSRSAKALVIGGIILVVGWVVYQRQQQPAGKERELQGQIVAIEAAQRTATLEFVHPQTGQPFQLSGQVPVDCPIEVDGKRAAFSDLRVSEQVVVRGVYFRSGRVGVHHIAATRDGASRPTAWGAESDPPSQVK